jgi:hypothetical protein
MNHMDRLNALVAVRKFVDAHPELPDNEEVLQGVDMGDLRTIVMPTTAEDVR